MLKHPKEAEEIVMNWVGKHVHHVTTNAEKYKKVFGVDPTFRCFADEEFRESCNSECSKCKYYYDSEYHVAEGTDET